MEATLTRPCTLPARSADAVLLGRLDALCLHGRVHSVFERAINIVGGAGELFTIACGALDNAPATIVVGAASFGALDVAVGDDVGSRPGILWIGAQVEIGLRACAPWLRRLPAYPSDLERVRARVQSARSLLQQHGHGGGMVARGQRAEAGPAFADAVEAALARRSSELLAALARADFASARIHAASLVGLGPGLTPSGDDFLLGLFAVLNVPRSPCQGWLGGGAEVVARAGNATNPISFAALAHAARGRVRESVVDFIDSLLLGRGDVPAATRRVLAIGSTSGADIACGVLAGLELNLKHATRGQAS